MLMILTKLVCGDKVNFSLLKFCGYNEFRGYFFISKMGRSTRLFLVEFK